jgi:hypothetical protein
MRAGIAKRDINEILAAVDEFVIFRPVTAGRTLCRANADTARDCIRGAGKNEVPTDDIDASIEVKRPPTEAASSSGTMSSINTSMDPCGRISRQPLTH